MFYHNPIAKKINVFSSLNNLPQQQPVKIEINQKKLKEVFSSKNVVKKIEIGI